MQQEEQQAEQEKQAALQRMRDRAAAAQKAAQESGIDPKTKRQYEYVTRKFAAWLEVHGAAVGYEEAIGPTLAVLRAFSAFCFTNRTYEYSALGNPGILEKYTSARYASKGSLLLPLTSGPCKAVLCLFKFIRSHNKEIQWGRSAQATP